MSTLPQLAKQEAPGAFNVIFTDVDGVLNCTQESSPPLSLDDQMLSYLKDLAQRASNSERPRHVKVVVSSDWRRKESLLNRLSTALIGYGLDMAGSIEPGVSKTEGIRLWLVQNAGMVDNWLALDDVDLAAIHRGEVVDCASGAFTDHFLLVDMAVGLTADDAKRGAELLQAAWMDKESDLQLMGQDLKLPATTGYVLHGPSRFACNDCGKILTGESAVEAHMTEMEHFMFSET
mmetsp:Transcript_1223/g.2243  ORF Transcript_1223/g.2243 Transcript_1223/m.2243 type:complete len:234 (+) Transcript_1223:94-795(+)